MTLKKNIFAFFIISTLGTLGHFIYDWSGNNKIIGYFFSVNESTWEHLKLLFFPVVIYSIFEYVFLKNKPENYIPAVVISLILGMAFIVSLYYTISGVIGYNIDFINVTIYYLGVILTLIIKNRIIKKSNFEMSFSFCIFLIIGICIALLFIFWTYNPPSLGIFTPPSMD